MRQGYAILFGAWQGDVVAEEGHMLAGFPIATDNGAPIAERSREEYVFGTTGSTVIAPLTLPCEHAGAERSDAHGSAT